MRNILLILFLWPALSFAEFDIKSFFHMPKQFDSNFYVSYKNDSATTDVTSGGTSLIERETDVDTIEFDYRFGLFDDVTLTFGFDKITDVKKDTYQTSTLITTLDDSGFTDFQVGAIARIKDATEGTTYMDVLIEISPNIFTREAGSLKVQTAAGITEGKPGNKANGGHILSGGVQFGKPMAPDWEWQGKFYYSLKFKGDEVQLSNNTRNQFTSSSIYTISARIQKFYDHVFSSVLGELYFQQQDSFRSVNSDGSVTEIGTQTKYGINLGVRSSFVWKTFYAGLTGGVTKFNDETGSSNGTALTIKGPLEKNIKLDFLFKI